MAPRSTIIRLALAFVVIATAAGIFFTRPAADTPPPGEGPAIAADLPRLLDLGADKCIPCKMMAPILEELRHEYAGRFEVEFIDVWKNPTTAKPYGVRVIPTQIFFAADGTELFRHEGFFGREDILGKWRELGLDVGAPAAPDQG